MYVFAAILTHDQMRLKIDERRMLPSVVSSRDCRIAVQAFNESDLSSLMTSEASGDSRAVNKISVDQRRSNHALDATPASPLLRCTLE